jgi:hypothetical protein
MSSPITEIKIASMSIGEILWLQKRLEQLQCSLTYISSGYYLVHVPEGTYEEICTAPDPQYQQTSLVYLPSGAMFKKAIKWPCSRSECPHAVLLLPEDMKRRKPGEHTLYPANTRSRG